MEDQDSIIQYFVEDDYKRLLKAVFDSAMVDYIKLQHSNNRNKKFLEESFKNSVDMFFDNSYRFEHFQDTKTQTKNLSFKQFMECYLDTTNINIKKIQNHIQEESIAYWWDKNFHNLEVPDRITIAGSVWTIINSPNNQYYDLENRRIYCSKDKIDSDKDFLKICLKILCQFSNIKMQDEHFELFFKMFYLFLKINSPFKQRKK